MEAIDFVQSAQKLGAPPGWDVDRDGPCDGLPIYRDGDAVLSCWKMSWKERLSALVFGRAWLWVHSGQTQPPVSLEATRDVFKPDSYAKRAVEAE